MDYVLVVKQSVYGSQGAFLAYQLAQELVQKHRICQIFFYQEGISNGNALVYPANDEFNLVNAWQDFAHRHNVPLHLCVAAAQRRGVVDYLTAREPEQTNLATGFIWAGLGEFSKAMLEADRVITL